jgi:tRNA 2-thiouridine synthesizing protein E
LAFLLIFDLPQQMSILLFDKKLSVCCNPKYSTRSIIMNQFNINALDTELSSQHASVRLSELNGQLWDRKQSIDMASIEDIKLSDEHWDVIVFLRDYYVEKGLPRFARTTSRALNKRFFEQGGSKYLYSLFSGGPVTQGSRIANLRTPAGATDVSFGTCY